MAGIGANAGNRAFNTVFSTGDRAGSIDRISEATFNAMTPAQLRAKYDVLLFTWASSTSLNGDWNTRIKPYLDLGGSIFWEDDRNIGDLAPGVIGNQNNGSFGSSYTILHVPPLTDGIIGSFSNHHLSVSSWSSEFSPYIVVGSTTFAIQATFPSGGRMIVQGPDQDFHAVRNGGNPGGNQYRLILNQLDWLTKFQNATYSWTGPNGFVATGPNPTLPNATAAASGVYTVTCTNDEGNTHTAGISVTVNPAPVVDAGANVTVVNGNSIALNASVSGGGSGSYFWSPATGLSNPNVATPTATPSITTVYTVTYTDATGCKGSDSVVVTVIEDNIPPALSCPGNIAVSTVPGGCFAPVSYNITATDDFGPVTISVTATGATTAGVTATGGTFNKGVTTIDCVATDANGNSSTCTFTVTVIDNELPKITCPADIVAIAAPGVCAGNVSFLATATDNCPDVTVTYSHDPGSVFGRGTTAVTATATDKSGNTASCTFNVTVLDTQAPIINVQASNATLESDGNGNAAAIASWLANNGGAAAIDNCGAIAWSHNYTGLSDGCGATGTATVIFTVTDGSGNTATTTATATVKDTKAPAITTVAADLLVEADGEGNLSALSGWLASQGGATATDVNGVTWTNNFTAVSDGCGATGSAAVTFTATDACGNSSSTTAAFTIVDTTAPSIATIASNQIVECDGAGNTAALSAWLASHGGASATDIGSNITWSHNFTAFSDDCGSTGSATVTFTATDACGNTSTTAATFTIVDTTAPNIATTASNQIVECDGAGNVAALNAWLASNGGAAASDACGGVAWSHNFTALSDDCGATGSATVTFVATDECGNTSQTTATFTIVDTTAPAITTAASSQLVECDGAGNLAALSAWLAGNGSGTASDGCGTVTWSNNFAALSDECGATGSATVTFTATDECGNTSTTTATFTIVDTTAPVLASNSRDILPNEAPITFALTGTDICGNAVTTVTNVTAHAINGAGKVIDKSGSAVIQTSGNQVTIVDSGGVGTIITIFGTAVDDCGDAASTQFIVNVLRPANEGVGNGVDGNTPGHDNNGGNDDPGNTPGKPGAKKGGGG